MKTSEILLACTVLSIVAGGGAALAAGALLGVRASRAELAQSRPLSVEARESSAGPDVARELDQLRMDNTGLQQRLAALEQRLAESVSTRVELASPAALDPDAPAGAAEFASLRAGEVTPEFVARVDEAMATIKAREDAEREAKRKELQAERIEEKIAELQTKLGLNHRQASDLRDVLVAQDDKREALFASMRDAQGDPRDMREGFRTIRYETFAALEAFLTPEQVEGYKQSEERDWGRGGGDRGGPPGFGGGFGDGQRPQREGR
jgi:chromosome segregation ATPase